MVCPLYRGCPLLGGSVIESSTIYVLLLCYSAGMNNMSESKDEYLPSFMRSDSVERDGPPSRIVCCMCSLLTHVANLWFCSYSDALFQVQSSPVYRSLELTNLDDITPTMPTSVSKSIAQRQQGEMTIPTPLAAYKEFNNIIILLLLIVIIQYYGI